VQKEILAANPDSRIRIVAVNDVGHEAGIPGAVGSDRTLPLLQDTAEVGAWLLWRPEYRDVVVLDDANGGLGVFNLTEHNLDAPADYEALLGRLRLAAGE